MEKYISTPTPPFSPTPTPIPIDPADVVQVDTSKDGDRISINGYDLKVTKNCTEYNRLTVSGDRNTITVKGVCRQIMINGDNNEITADAAMEFVFNGAKTTSRIPLSNGKQPSIVDNQEGNVVEKVAVAAADKIGGSKRVLERNKYRYGLVMPQQIAPFARTNNMKTNQLISPARALALFFLIATAQVFGQAPSRVSIPGSPSSVSSRAGNSSLSVLADFSG